MATTALLNINNTSWTPVPNAGTYLAIQVNVVGQVKIHISDVEPADTDKTGVLIARQRDGVPGSFAAGGLPDGAVVYARVADDAGSVNLDIVYLTY